MSQSQKKGMLATIRRYLRNLNDAPRDIYIGVHKGDAPRDETGESEESTNHIPNNAQVAATHEFGIGVPKRSFLRSTIREHRDDYKALLVNLLRQNLRQKNADPERPFHIVGNKAVADVRQTIVRGVHPPLSEQTLERRKKRGFKGTKPLVETGQLKSSIAYSIKKPGEEGEQ